MNPCAIILTQPQINLQMFLHLSQEMLGYSPARTADAINLKGPAHLMACLASFRDQKANITVKGTRDIYELLHFGVLIAADERDMPSILEALGGMPFALTETLMRGLLCIYASGSLNQWRIAIARGCKPNQTTQVRICFDKLFLAFVDLGLSDAFNLSKKTAPDHTFYLEDQR